MTFDPALLDDAFGHESRGETPEERARSSGRTFVRSLFQIAEDSPKATGRRLSASEALAAYGWDTMAEVGAEGFANLAASPKAGGQALERRLRDLGLTPQYVAESAKLTAPAVERMLRSDPSIPLDFYERAARALGLDERLIGVRPEPSGNEALTVRLRTVEGDNPKLTPSAVSAIAEAAWVASTQARLEQALGIRRALKGFDPSPNYGGPGYPAYLHGYYLAHRARATLGFGENPIGSFRELSEERLGIPIIQTDLGSRIAGVTVDTGTVRAIVLNLGGNNRTAFVRRSTIAHELGHLLYDPPERLNSLRVDDYDDLERRSDELPDPVEQRANAFSVQLIAPQGAVVAAFKQSGLATVIRTFGISATAAAYQIWNGLERRLPLESIRTPRLAAEDVQVWEAAEAYTVDMHPLRKLRWSRRGRFSAVVVRAAERGVISWDTAAQYLESTEAETRASIDDIRDLYPSVFAS